MHMSGRTALLLFVLMVAALMLSACSSEGTGSQTATPAQSSGLPAGEGVGNVITPTANAAATIISAEPTVTATAAAQPADTAAQPAVTQPAAASTQAQPTTASTGNVPQTGNGAEAAATASDGVPTDSVTAFPDPSQFKWNKVVDQLSKPLALATPADGTNRMFVVEQAGTIRVAQNGALLPDPFLDITSKVGSRGNEQGLLGLALHPDFATNGLFYVNYTDTNGNTVIARFNVSKDDPNRADPNSQKDLLHVDQPYPNHNGGSMVFGPDGYLYMGLGDGGSGGDPHGNGQSTDTLLGKILRVDVNNADPYAIPSDNPFAAGGGKPEIWAYGLRNPWRFSFDRLTKDLYVADVGQNQWEEIDFLPAGSPGGANFGWNYREGAHAYKGNPPASVNLIDPVYEYSHGNGCSVTGGYVYRGQALPELRGIYIFADFCSGRIWGLLRGADGTWQGQQLYQERMSITSFGQDNNGEIYAIDQPSGTVYRLEH